MSCNNLRPIDNVNEKLISELVVIELVPYLPLPFAVWVNAPENDPDQGGESARPGP